jgi:protein-tyrosine kinase
MSRFYHALRGADLGLSGSANGPAAQPALTPLEPKLEPETASDPAADRIEMLDIASPENAWNPLPSAVSQDLLGRHADVVLDKTARLIPHAVDPTVIEHYRRLRTKIMQQHRTKPFRSLLVTSPNPGEGKSVTALNLGLSFAMLPSFRVVVVDGDLRKGSLGRWLGVAQRPGLSNLIEGSATLEDVVLKSDESPMCFVVSGTSEASPGELLNSAELGGHFRRLSQHFDMIVVDSSPVNLITDTQLLAASCDAILLVARAFATTHKSLEKAVHDLAPFRIVGTILNGGLEHQRDSYYYGYRGN